MRRCVSQFLRLSQLIVLLILLGVSADHSSAQVHHYSLALKGSFTTTSRVYYNLNSPSQFLRNLSVPLDGIKGAGAEFRFMVDERSLQVGLSGEFLAKTETFVARQSGVNIPVEEGFWAIPIELSGYFLVPFSSESFRIYIGGGVGAYLGARRYAIAHERAQIVDRTPGFGIHVLTGVEYAFLPWLAARGDLKFRDVHFETVHRFEKPSVNYDGVIVPLDQTPARSRVNIDGMLLDVGFVVRF